MNIIKYHKLVRDRIPEIIESAGKKCICSELSDEAYIAMLDAKLNEELAEYQESKSLEELADLLEVMQATVLARVTLSRSWNAFVRRRLPSVAALPSGYCWRKCRNPDR